MNQITRRNANGSVTVPEAVETPSLPASAARYLRDMNAYADAKAVWQAAHPDARDAMFVGHAPRVPGLFGSERAEVDIATAAMDRDLAPVTPAQFQAWMRPVNAAVRNPQPEEDFTVRCMGIYALVSDMPGGAFTAEARRSLPAFFPSAADVRSAVEPGANKLRRTRAALAAFDRAPPPPTEPPPAAARTAEEIAAVRAKVGAFVATTIHAPATASAVNRDKPLPLSDGALLAHFELLAERGNRAAAFRAKILRERLAGAE